MTKVAHHELPAVSNFDHRNLRAARDTAGPASRPFSRLTRLVRLALVLASFSLLCGFKPVCSHLNPAAAESHGPAEALYLKLRSVGLDPRRVYKIREASLDRAKLHIALDDGTIAFTEAVDGRITGAFFAGYGEVLVIPPNEMERDSVSLFTGSAILEETFSTAYLRFNDDVFAELNPFLRPAEDGPSFVSQWNTAARMLAADDALRLVFGFSDSLPGAAPASPPPPDRMLHAIVTGNKLGGFDLRYDSLLEEQIRVGQHRRVNGEDYYDIWTSFAVPALRSSSNSAIGDPDETPNAELEITSFKIRAEVRPVKEFEAKATLRITARQRTRRALLFELSRMLAVREVRADGQPVEFIHNQAVEGSHLAKQGNDMVAVILAKPLEQGQKTELTFDYAGSVLSEAANGLLYVGDRGTWYPNVGFAMASFDLEFRYPEGWTLVATGHRAESKTAGGDEISRWVTERPVPIAGFNLGKYSEATTHARKVTITTYATRNVERGFPGTASAADPLPPILPDPGRAGLPRVVPLKPAPPEPSPIKNLETVGASSARAIEFYERYFGAYPYGELAITQLPGTVSQGWPGLIFLSSYSFLSPEEQSRVEPNRARRLESEQVVAHETAHQWWGDLINWDSYRDQWVVEALANYSALMLLESHDPEKFHQILEFYRDALLARNEKGRPLADAGPVTLGYRLSSSQFPGAYEPVCYGRGTWLFHMLRTMMRDSEARTGRATATGLGDEPFIRVLRKLTRDYADKSLSTAVLMRVFASELPESLQYEGRKSLDWFLESWINGKAIPLFHLRELKFSDHEKTTVVSGTLVEEEAPETLVSAVPLYATIGGKNVFLRRVFAEGPQTQFRLSAPAGTRKLVIDPEHTLLSRAK
ncbi:MAG: hypothetical protein J2P13_10560 [Acidobacteria bacterium]|nr:hypothetical protein [Acidobacteriota bacterium]